MKHNYFKRLGIFIFSFFIVQTVLSQNWVSTNLTPNDAFNMVDVVSHDNTLFATYGTGITGELRASVDDGQTWTTPTATNVLGFRMLLASAGTRLYLTSNHNFDSYVYYSTDGGATFTQDTNGLPSGFFGGVLIIDTMQVLDNKLVVGMGGSGYYYKPLDAPATPFASFDTPTGLNSGTDKLGFFDGKLYTYDNAGATTFYKSTTFGTSWTTPAATGLPTDLSSEVLVVNPVSGRIYLSGTSSSGTVYGLYYSDDEGENWSQMDLSMVSSTNYLGDFHKVTALYAEGELFYAAFDNDIDESYPDVIKSDAISTTAPAVDVTGLPDDAPGNVHGTKIILHNNKPTMTLNIIDLYIKDQSLSTNNYVTSDFKLYPTIVKDILTVNSNDFALISLFDISGKLVLETNKQQNKVSIDLSTLESGVYFVKLSSASNIKAKKIIKL